MIDTILTNTVLPAISRELLSRMADSNPLKSVDIGVKDAHFHYDFG
jgi:type VI secretion system protein VasG